jgi:hypothetical protein
MWVLASDWAFGSVSSFAAGSQELTAIVTADNDMSLADYPIGKRVPVPGPVQMRIHALVSRAVERRRTQGITLDDYGVTVEYFYGPIIRITMPDEKYLFVFKQKDMFGVIFYHLILFDPMAELVTQDPPAIYGRWMEGGDWGAKLENPLVSFDDLDQDGRPELVIEERVHNGTMYNAVVYHYFKIDPDLSLFRIMALETRLIDLFTEDQEGAIVRKITKLEPNRLKIGTFLQIPNQQLEPLGEVIVGRRTSNGPFQVVSRHPFNLKYREFLICAFGEEDEDRFLRIGYNFYY